MGRFNELIKNYDKIRDYIREFLLHGYKYRSDFSEKSNRSYDNERRRIENYLSGYIKNENSIKGKKFYISSSSIDLEANPLFTSWQSKSFTKNDIMLHFILLDILEDTDGLSIKEITEIIYNDYIFTFDNPRLPDTMTIRNKLTEYVDLAIVEKSMVGRQAVYQLVDNCLAEDEANIAHDLVLASRYFQNILPAGILGYFFQEQFPKVEPNGIFSFRHQFFVQTLDDEILLKLFEAIQNRQFVMIDMKAKNARQSTIRLKILPITILNNIYTGRRYIAAYKHRGNKYETYRLDKILNVIPEDVCERFEDHRRIIKYHLSKAWGVSINRDKPLEKIEIVLRINKSERYILDRIEREGKHGDLTEVGNGLFNYEIEVSDAWEVIPWLRTFIGRIEIFKCSNKYLERYFWKDVKTMYDMYREVE